MQNTVVDKHKIKASDIVFAWAHEHGFIGNSVELEQLAEEIATALKLAEEFGGDQNAQQSSL